jgi:hypothetical protein
MEAVHTSETSVYSNDTTRRYIPGGSNLHTHRRENLKCYTFHFLRIQTNIILPLLNQTLGVLVADGERPRTPFNAA